MADPRLQYVRAAKEALIDATHASHAVVDSDADTDIEDEQFGEARGVTTRKELEAAKAAVEAERRTRRVVPLPVAAAAAAAASQLVLITHAVMEDDPVDDDLERDLDDMHLRQVPSGLFPGGIADVRPARLFMGARIELRDRGLRMQAHLLPPSERVFDMYRVAVGVFDESYTRSIGAGYFKLAFKGPRSGIALDLFYGNRARNGPDWDTWQAIHRQTTLDPKLYMVSVLRSFIRTHLVRHLFLGRHAPIRLDAVASRSTGNDQRRLVDFYTSIGFTIDAAGSEGIEGTGMHTTVGTFLHFTQHLVRWESDMSAFQSQHIQIPPLDAPHIFPVTQRFAMHAHM